MGLHIVVIGVHESIKIINSTEILLEYRLIKDGININSITTPLNVLCTFICATTLLFHH